MINTIVFDLGGVLIDWNPEYVFLKEFRGDREKMNWFFENICTSEWNEQQDAGYNLEQATLERIALFPEHERHIRMYYGEWEQMLGYELTGTVEILKKLYQSDVDIKVSGNYRLGDIRHNKADISKIKKLLGFSPKVSFEDGLKQFVDWVKNQEVNSDNYEQSINEMKDKGLMK